MKPGDHPDFFRMAPPPGASRESNIRLDRDGNFWHEGALVEKRSLALALHTWLKQHPDDGRPILENGYDWCYLTVDDTLAFVADVKADANGAPLLVLADGGEEALVGAALSVDDEGGLFAQVSGGREARFLRHAQLGIAPWLVEADPPSVEIAGRRFVLPRRGQARPAQ